MSAPIAATRAHDALPQALHPKPYNPSPWVGRGSLVLNPWATAMAGALPSGVEGEHKVTRTSDGAVGRQRRRESGRRLPGEETGDQPQQPRAPHELSVLLRDDFAAPPPTRAAAVGMAVGRWWWWRWVAARVCGAHIRCACGASDAHWLSAHRATSSGMRQTWLRAEISAFLLNPTPTQYPST